MRALRELQSDFYDAVVRGAEAHLMASLAGPPEDGRRRIAAYRRSVFGNLVGALLATYPVLARIVGLPFFGELAAAYVRERPSASGDLNEYGADFAGSVAAWPHGRELGYLADVARLEWRVQQVYYAADAAPDLAALAACAPEDYGALRFVLAPAFARLDSDWPLDEIWRVHAAGYEGDMAVDFSRGARLAVLRRAGRVQVETLSTAEAAFLDALVAGADLDAAAAAGLETETDFDLGAALARFAGNGAILRALPPGMEGSP